MSCTLRADFMSDRGGVNPSETPHTRKRTPMFCNHCGAPNPDESHYCRVCGQDISWRPPVPPPGKPAPSVEGCSQQIPRPPSEEPSSEFPKSVDSAKPSPPETQTSSPQATLPSNSNESLTDVPKASSAGATRTELDKRLTSMSAELSSLQKKSTRGLYIWLCLLLAMFLAWLASFLFIFVSHLTFSGSEEWPKPNPVPLVLFIAGIAADWKAILARESESEYVFKRKHRRFNLATGVLFGIIAVVSVFAGVWNGHRREKVQRIESFLAQTPPLAEIGNRIGNIKARELKSANDYVNAFEEIASIMPEWKKRFDNVAKGLEEVKGYELDAKTSSMLAVDMAAIDIGREEISLTEKEIDVT